MSVRVPTLEEVRQRGIAALARELGAVGMIRFLQQFETGAGDYTQERRKWLPDDVGAVVAAIREKPPEELSEREH